MGTEICREEYYPLAGGFMVRRLIRLAQVSNGSSV